MEAVLQSASWSFQRSTNLSGPKSELLYVGSHPAAIVGRFKNGRIKITYITRKMIELNLNKACDEGSRQSGAPVDTGALITEAKKHYQLDFDPINKVVQLKFSSTGNGVSQAGAQASASGTR